MERTVSARPDGATGRTGRTGAPDRGLVATGGFACLAVALQQTLLVPALPRLPALLSTTPTAVSWAVTATLLTGAIATPILGRLADLRGKRAMMLLSMACVLIGSLLAPLGGVGTLIAGRALQGLGTALVPIAMAQMRDSLQPERVGPALAVLSATLGVGGGLGIPLGGQILGLLGWQWLFWLSALLSVVSIALILAVFPPSTPDDSGRIDVIGALLMSAGLLFLLLGLSQGGSWGWTSPATLGLIVAALAVLAGWVAFELRHPSPLVDLRVSGARALLNTNLASILMGSLMFSNLLLTTLTLQNPRSQGGFAWTAAQAGLAMLPNAAAMFVVAPLTARLAARLGPRAVLQIGAVVTGAGYLLRLTLAPSAPLVIVWATLIGIGVGIGYAALPMLVVQYAPLREMGSANAVNALMRAIGTTLASAAVGSITTSLFVMDAGRTVPSSGALILVSALGVLLSLAALILASQARPSRAGSDSSGRHSA